MMQSLPVVRQYFPDLSEAQFAQLEQLTPLYLEWNSRVNVISRQDVDNLELRHILHSLAVGKVFEFKPGARVLDLGTGGGFPGIPLAILFPEVQFTLIDGTGKKITVVREIAKALGLKNATARHVRAEDLHQPGTFDFVVSRAVAPLDQLMFWGHRLLKKKHTHAYPNGLIALKGGNLSGEIAGLPGDGTGYTEVFPISAFFSEPWFEEKYLVYVQG